VKGHAATLVAMLTGVQHGPTPDLGAITAPTLLITGATDGYMPPRRARALAAAMPHARAVTVPGAAHLLFDEQPDICAAHIRAHLLRGHGWDGVTVRPATSISRSSARERVEWL
jgi:pimeloyl-ACP methyl ester carboxylesterase